MNLYPKPHNEAARLAAVKSYKLLDSMPEQEYNDIVKIAATICDVPISTIALLDESRKWHKAKYGIDKDSMPRAVAICAYTILDKIPLVVPDTKNHEIFCDIGMVANPPYVQAYAGIPLVDDDGYALGTLCVIDKVPRNWTSAQIDILCALARQIMTLFKLRKAQLLLEVQQQELEFLNRQARQENSELKELSKLDELTGALNRRGFNLSIESMLDKFNKDSVPFSLLIIDIDHFKKFNDTFGHLEGDRILAKIVSIFQKEAQNSDLVARYGGEEFVIILPDIDRHLAPKVAERYRCLVGIDKFINNTTVSIGFTTVKVADDAAKLLQRADKALYQAKQGGRNCCRGI